MSIHTYNWGNLPLPACFIIFSMLSREEQLRFASTCKKLYKFYLRYVKEPGHLQIGVYLANNVPPPDSLVDRMTVLRVPGIEIDEKAIQKRSFFLKAQILRMKNLHTLLLDESPVTKKCPLLEQDIYELAECPSLRKVKASHGFLTDNPLGKGLPLSACRNTILAESISSQIELYSLLHAVNELIRDASAITLSPFNPDTKEETAEVRAMKALMLGFPQVETAVHLLEIYFYRLHQDEYISIYADFFKSLMQSPSWGMIANGGGLQAIGDRYFQTAFDRIKDKEEYQASLQFLVGFFSKSKNTPEWKETVEKELYDLCRGDFLSLHYPFIHYVMNQVLKSPALMP